MNHARWIFPSVLALMSGCATDPASQLAEPPTIVKSEAPKAEGPAVAEKTAVASVTPKAAAPITPAPLPPEVFEDAAMVAPAPARVPAPVAVIAAPAPQPVAAVPTVVAALAQPAPVAKPPSAVRVLPQAALPPSVAPLSVPSGPKPMTYLNTLEQSGGAPGGDFGFVLIDAQTGTTLSERNADMPLPPASIAKLLAAVAILDTMGPNSSFRTSLMADGPVSGGVLNGDLHLVGSGDPSLNRSDLSGLAQRLASAGVRKVNGRFYYHGDALPETSSIDAGQPSGAVYNPGISGLNLDHNEHRGASPVKNPARYTADAMRRAASSAGVDLPAPTKGRGGAKGQEIAAHDSAPVSAILTEMFDISRNMTAEVLGAVAASKISGKPGSLREAARINSQWAESTIGPIGGSDWNGFNFVNNSGLTNRSKATPRQMAALVRHGYQRHGDQFKRVYEEQSSGSNAGVDYAIRAKIGTMSYVRGLGGIITLGGRDMIFAIMANDTARRAGAKNWMGKARRLEQALMSDWLQNNWPTTRTASR